MLLDGQGKTSADLQREFKVYGVQMELAQYPILARKIRERMRQELFSKGFIAVDAFEAEAVEKAILSQQREGLAEPVSEEPAGVWHERIAVVRDQLTDFYFAYNLPPDRLKEIIQSVLAGRAPEPSELALTFNPELAPWELLFVKGEEYESLAPEEQARICHHLQELVVVLIKGMISDRLEFVRIAKEIFTIKDLREIKLRRIGRGKIGGKAAGMLLAWKILRKHAPLVAEHIVVPNSYFIGADVFYDFLSLNGLALVNQKYKTPQEIQAEYPQIREQYENARLPQDIAEHLRDILRRVGKMPLIVRSSSLLEDNLGTSFAGKYESYFCPNQGTLADNLQDLIRAICRVYASIYSPDALFYRQQMGLIDYDERMAILLQEVQGQKYKDYFFPALSGVAFSFSPIVWSRKLRREEGFVRLVLGLGTRAVDRVGEDYPRLITLSHPTLRPEASPAAVKRYSQRYIDLINLRTNEFKSVSVSQALDWDYPPLRWVASVSQEDALSPLSFIRADISPDQLVLTFDGLLQDSNFAPLMKNVLATLSQHYRSPVDVEFALSLTPGSPQPSLTFHLLQCRPQSNLPGEAACSLPTSLSADDQLFKATRIVPQGHVSQVEYIVYVDPLAYSQIPDPVRRKQVARTVGRLNQALEGHNFILIGPGRWGSSNIQLGVPVTYADIYHARALVELSISQTGVTPEPSYGTHFFQDLVEAHIYPLAVYPGEPGELLNQDFLDQAQNCLATWLPEEGINSHVKVIHIPTERPGRHLEIAMDGEQALAYFSSAEQLVRTFAPIQNCKGVTDRW